MKLKPPLACAECEAPRWNDTSVIWVDGRPYCAAGESPTCAEIKMGELGQASGQDDDEGEYPGGWFGESWGAPVCDEDTRQPPPVGWACSVCNRPIEVNDQGLLIAYVYELGSMSLTAEHIACFRRTVGMLARTDLP